MLEHKDFQKDAKAVINWIEQYFENLHSYPVKSAVKPQEVYDKIPAVPPVKSEPFAEILKDLDDIIMPGITHWQHPNFHAYFPANSSLESLFAEFITAAIGAQCMIWDTSPAAAELEERVMEWLKSTLNIPDHFEGVIQDTASTATLAAILTAREVKTNFKSNDEGVPNNLRVYCSTETHSSIDKAVGISGIGRNNLVKIETDDGLRLDPAALRTQIEKDIEEGYQPCCIIVAIGTTGTVAVDPLKEIALIGKEYNIWVHVDAAYAGTALMLPEYHWMIEGIELADSFVFNPHKWMFTNFDCSVYFVKDASILIKTFEVLPEYLKTKTRGEVNDYRDWGIPLGRRFRALKLWFVIRSFGIDGIQERLRYHIKLNQYFHDSLNEDSSFEILLEPFLNFTCFRLNPYDHAGEAELNEINENLLEMINSSGKLFLSHTKARGKYALRMVVGQTYIKESDVAKALQVIKEHAVVLAK